MALFKVVKTVAHYEDQIHFVEAPDQETACKRLSRAGQPVLIETREETSVAAVLATKEEKEDYG